MIDGTPQTKRDERKVGEVILILDLYGEGTVLYQY